MKVLIISFYFPPAGGGGVQRVLKLAKFLPQSDITVHVVAPDDSRWIDRDDALTVPASTIVHRVPYRGFTPGRPAERISARTGRVARLLTKVAQQPRRLMIPDVVATWAPGAAREAIRVVRDEGIDVVISSSPPPSVHLAARRVQKATGVKWIADFRDSWLEEPSLRTDSRFVRMKLAIAEWLARRSVGHADAIVAVSAPLHDEAERRWPNRPGGTHTIMNGIDRDDMPAHASEPRDDSHFTITYTGNFFGRRSPRPFLNAVQRVCSDDPSIANELRVRFIGALVAADVALIANDSVLRNVVQIEPFMQYHASLQAQRDADALYLAIAQGPHSAGEVTGKVFEYVAATRPILAIVPPTGSAAQLLGNVPWARVVSPDDHSGIDAQLRQLIAEWRSTGRSPDAHVDDAIDALISREARARTWVQLIRDVCGVPAGTLTRRAR